jgi:tRNA modification GTPase
MNGGTDTIAAIATPLGEGGIGIVRLSGEKALAIAAELFVSSSGKNPRTSPRPVFHGEIRDDSGEAVDEVLLHVMRAPHSYTREDVVEINCHGGAAPLSAVLTLVLAHGARLAEPGEFTKRAFLSGRIDLVQAEAVIDRIRARTRAGLRAATAAAHGALSQELHSLREVLANALARVEAAVDFPEEDVPELVTQALREELLQARARMQHLLDTSEAGRLYREGAQVVLAGRPNVGKSSLFNALLRDARAIVTAIPGTTRDLLEETITLSGVPVRLTDVAGLRPAQDEVEQIGVDRARRALKTADAVVLVVDASAPVSAEDERLAEELQAQECPVLLALNKSDLVSHVDVPLWARGLVAVCPVSALTGAGLHELEQELGRLLLHDASVDPGQALLTRAHQQDSLRKALAAVDQGLANFEASPEFLSVDLREALNAVGQITGETTPDEVLGRIFASFCIGK